MITIPPFVTVASSCWSIFIALVCCNEDVAPVIGWNEQLWIEDHAPDIRLEYLADSHLFHRQPGDVVDQLLLGLIIGLHARSLVLIHISRCQRCWVCCCVAASAVLF